MLNRHFATGAAESAGAIKFDAFRIELSSYPWSDEARRAAWADRATAALVVVNEQTEESMWIAPYDIGAESWLGKPLPDGFLLLYVVGWLPNGATEVVRATPNILDVEELFRSFFEENVASIYQIFDNLMQIDLVHKRKGKI